MTQKQCALVTVVGLVVLTVGLIVGFAPLSHDYCGNAFARDDRAIHARAMESMADFRDAVGASTPENLAYGSEKEELLTRMCNDERGVRQIFTWVLIVLGGVVALLGAALLLGGESTGEPSALSD